MLFEEKRLQHGDFTASVISKLKRKMPIAIEKAQGLDFIPYTVKDNQWHPGLFDEICWWTNGFWPGEMWAMYRLTGEERYKEEAERTEKMLDAAFVDYDRLHHDVGFMWLISSGANFRMTGNDLSRKRTQIAANLLAGRFNPAGFIRAWNMDRTGWAIIDCMMNLSLLYWASEKSGDPRFRKIAMAHADTAMQHFVREDGSCNHIVIFDPETMNVLDKPGGQGYGPGSSWSRGQGWAMYGFMISYCYTGKKEYLDTARKVSDYFLSCIGEDGIPDSDFRAPKADIRKDNVAGALAACALIDLSRELKDEHYLQEALRLLRAMEQTDADWSQDCPAIFQRCRAAWNSDAHQTMQYGDYFFIEAINKLRGETYRMW